MNYNISAVSFGQKLPTRKVVALASNINLYDGHFEDNMKLINSMVGKKSDLKNKDFREWISIFGAVSNVLRTQFPQMNPILDSFENISNIKDKLDYQKHCNTILDYAEISLGKTLDVSTSEIKNVVSLIR